MTFEVILATKLRNFKTYHIYLVPLYFASIMNDIENTYLCFNTYKSYLYTVSYNAEFDHITKI